MWDQQRDQINAGHQILILLFFFLDKFLDHISSWIERCIIYIMAEAQVLCRTKYPVTRHWELWQNQSLHPYLFSQEYCLLKSSSVQLSPWNLFIVIYIILKMKFMNATVTTYVYILHMYVFMHTRCFWRFWIFLIVPLIKKPKLEKNQSIKWLNPVISGIMIHYKSQHEKHLSTVLYFQKG